MTITVGKSYRGIFCGHPGWLRVTTIEVGEGNSTNIIFRAAYVRLPRILSWFATLTSDDLQGFLRRMDDAAQMDAHPKPQIRTVREIRIPSK